MLGVITPGAEGQGDRLMQAAAQMLLSEGLRVLGVVQENPAGRGAQRSVMMLRLLPDGPSCRISQDLGPGTSGCQLDPGALERAVEAVAQALAAGPVDLLLVNKFGRQEAEGRGFRALIGEALSRGIPVLTLVRPAQAAAFGSFAEGLATPVAPDLAAIRGWYHGLGVLPDQVGPYA